MFRIIPGSSFFSKSAKFLSKSSFCFSVFIPRVLEITFFTFLDVRTKVKLETALMLAVRSVNVFACEQLLANKKTAVEMQNSSGLTAFMVACASGHDSLFDLLVSRGAKVTTTSHRGATGAHLAARYGHVNILQKLNQIQPDLFG